MLSFLKKLFVIILFLSNSPKSFGADDQFPRELNQAWQINQRKYDKSRQKEIKVKAVEAPAGRNNNCANPNFIQEFSARANLKSGVTQMAALGVFMLPNTSAYKQLAELAKTSSDAAKMKSFVDDLHAAAEEVRRKNSVAASIIEKEQSHFENKYGKEFRKNPILYQEFHDRIEAAMNSKNVGYFSGNHGNTQALEDTIAEKWNLSENPMMLDLMVEQKIFLAFEAKALYPVAREAFGDFASSPRAEKDFKDSARKARGSLRNLLSAEVESESAMARMRGFSKSPSLAGGIAMGLVAVVGAQLTQPAQAATALVKCRAELGLTNSEVRGLIDHVEMRNVPGVFDSSACASIHIAPGHLTEIMDEKGTFSNGQCNLLQRDVANWTKDQEKPFVLKNESCDQTDLSVNGQSIGQFKRIDGDRYDFEILGSGKYRFGAAFPVQYNGGMEFDPQSIHCFQANEAENIPRSTCSSKLRDSVMDRDSGFGQASLHLSRAKMMNSKRLCEIHKDDPMFDPLCKFSKNASIIEQASVLYALKCYGGFKTLSSKKSAQPAHTEK